MAYSRLCNIPVLVLMLFALGSSFSWAQERSYLYDTITYHIDVREDSTVHISERQSYRFNGEYHQGYRSISHDRVSAITDILVRDAKTDTALSYSKKRLDKTDPESWGKYTTYTENGETVIEWYYDSTTTNEWVLEYVVHGGLSFYDAHDELYWDLFTELDAPVRHVEAFVILPSAVTAPKSFWYVNGEHGALINQPDDRTFHFVATDFAPEEPATVAVGWQKGLVQESAFWKDWFLLNWLYMLSFSVVLGAVLFAIGHWFVKEKYRTGRGTVVAQYEPPKALTPAMADLIVHERLSRKVWPATVVDLAVRGYLTIAEETTNHLGRMGELLGLRFLSQKDYVLTGTQKEGELKEYEKEFLNTLFTNGSFSTKVLRKSPSAQTVMHSRMQNLEKKLIIETEQITDAYELLVSKEKTGIALIISIVGASIFLFSFGLLGGGVGVFIAALAFAVAIVFYSLKFEARLNKEGQILREEWLGFKLYLETAERYRVQNLTPDIFEKYLPYAIIFGVEKKWAKAFESLHMAPPQWYSGNAVAFAAGSSGGGFSPSSFTSSFSASFSSAFAGSGGGASGGGGSAGGGGGGGGGGAS